jgi:hypothetical protein
MHRTLNQIRTEGLAALRKKLGRAGMIRFLQQFETGQGDYVQRRRDWTESITLGDLKQETPKRTKTSRQSRR